MPEWDAKLSLRWDIKPFGAMYALPSSNGIMRPSAVRGSGFKMVNMGELYQYPRLRDPPMERVKLSASEIQRFTLRKGDLLFARQSLVLEGAGKCCVVLDCEQNTCFESHLIRVRLDPHKADPIFYYYFFKSGTGSGTMQSIVSQVSAAGIRGSDLTKLKVLCPPLPTQRKIAAILSAYDELIENNRRRIALLEKMAEEIYREWFVRLRFPGYEKLKKVKGVPEGWSFDQASASFSVIKGKSYAGDEITDNPRDMPFLSLKSFNRGGGYREDGLKYYSGSFNDEQVVRKNDVIMAVTDMTQDRAVVGRVARVPDFGDRGGVLSLDAVKLVPHEINATFLYAYMRYSGFSDFIKEFANGTNVLHLKSDLIVKQRIVLPPRTLQDRFALLAEPLLEQSESLGASIKILNATRNLLLPRLISGKLSVENLDIQFPPGMSEEEETR